jgi:hypothetical protein
MAKNKKKPTKKKPTKKKPTKAGAAAVEAVADGDANATLARVGSREQRLFDMRERLKLGQFATRRDIAAYYGFGPQQAGRDIDDGIVGGLFSLHEVKAWFRLGKKRKAK